jgi:hypothetical protein
MEGIGVRPRFQSSIENRGLTLFFHEIGGKIGCPQTHGVDPLRAFLE